MFQIITLTKKIHIWLIKIKNMIKPTIPIIELVFTCAISFSVTSPLKFLRFCPSIASLFLKYRNSVTCPFKIAFSGLKNCQINIAYKGLNNTINVIIYIPSLNTFRLNFL